MEISTLFKAPISFLPSIIRHLELDRFGMNNYQLPSSNSNHHLPTSSPSHDGFPHRNQHQPLQTHPHGRPQECRAQGQARTRKAPKEDRKARQENREARQEDRKGRQEAPRVDRPERFAAARPFTSLARSPPLFIVGRRRPGLPQPSDGGYSGGSSGVHVSRTVVSRCFSGVCF
jgi:hypothetical protein